MLKRRQRRLMAACHALIPVSYRPESASMTILLLGLLIFLGIHSIRIVAEPRRAALYAQLGEAKWKGLYSLVSALGFGLIIWGFGLARQDLLVLWTPPTAMRHIAALLVAISFVLLAAAYIPNNSIKGRVHHPMILGVKLWAFAHLLANGKLADVVLFGSFLVWAVFCFKAARQRDRVAGTTYPAGSTAASMVTLVVGLLAWAVFAFWLHGVLIGVRPLG
jgi:uncharacterized membrane protein